MSREFNGWGREIGCTWRLSGGTWEGRSLITGRLVQAVTWLQCKQLLLDEAMTDQSYYEAHVANERWKDSRSPRGMQF